MDLIKYFFFIDFFFFLSCK